MVETNLTQAEADALLGMEKYFVNHAVSYFHIEDVAKFFHCNPQIRGKNSCLKFGEAEWIFGRYRCRIERDKPSSYCDLTWAVHLIEILTAKKSLLRICMCIERVMATVGQYLFQ